MRTPRSIVTAVLTLGALGLAAAPAAAQHPQARDGFWAGVGMGWGSFGLSCDGCDGVDRTGSYSGYIKLGGTLRPNLLLGAELNGWHKNEDGASVELGNASAAAYWYPMVQSGLFLTGGVGYSRLSAESGGIGASDGGFGLLAGVGYDLRVARTTSLTPVLNYFRGGFDGGSADVVQLGLGVTFH
ncbi:MAG: outer membrane beta-barrel protein [Gemmatimonadales bacterium]